MSTLKENDDKFELAVVAGFFPCGDLISRTLLSLDKIPATLNIIDADN